MPPKQYLRMTALPLASTSAIFGEYMLADPTAEEEAQALSLVTFTSDRGGRPLRC